MGNMAGFQYMGDHWWRRIEEEKIGGVKWWTFIQ
jgi:hypothetical protein